MDFHYNTSGKLREIFKEHCNMSLEQYKEIDSQFSNLVTDIREDEPQQKIDNRIDYMRHIFTFLFNTDELTVSEEVAMNKLLTDVIHKWKRTAAILATEERRVL